MSDNFGIGHNSGLLDGLGGPAPGGEIEQARDAAERAAGVIQGFFKVPVSELLKETRGAADEAFARQFLMASLVFELGFSSQTVGNAIGRDKATVEHACRLIEAFRGAISVDDLVENIVGLDGVMEYLGGIDGAAEFLERSEKLIDDLFAAIRVVAVQGEAFTRAAAIRKRAAIEQAPMLERRDPPAALPLLQIMDQEQA